MIIPYKGKITDNLYVTGNAASPAFLMTGKEPALIDAGLGLMGPVYLDNLKNILGNEKKLRYVFMTHSHFDHCGAVPYLKKMIPGLQTGASSHAKDIFIKPRAVELIRHLNNELAIDQTDEIKRETEFCPFELDLPFPGDNEFHLGNGISFEVIATPGHTRDSVSYYFPSMKLLFTGEAAGVFDNAFNIMPEFLSSYEDYMASLEKMASLDIDYLLPGHYYYVTKKDSLNYLRKSMNTARQFKDRIIGFLDRYNGDCAAVIERIYQEDYIASFSNIQPLKPYLLNLEAQVRGIAKNNCNN